MSATLESPEVLARIYRWSIQDYVTLTEENPAFRHFELIHGLIVKKMSKTPSHSTLTKRSYDFFLRQARMDLSVRRADPLWLADSMPEPDVAIVRGTTEDFELRHPTVAELVIEVAVSSVASDREKALLYAEADVAEYWIVLAEDGQIETYRQPENGVYQEKRTYRRGETIPCACVEGGEVPVATWFA